MKWLLASLGLLFFVGCSGHSSAQQMLVADRYMVYKDTYKAYKDAEEEYLNLLDNLERMPEEEELWVMKRDKMLELLQLKELMLTARTELDNAMQDWERHLTDVQAEVKRSQVKSYNPNFTGMDGKRTSPGQLLPGEANQINKKKQ